MMEEEAFAELLILSTVLVWGNYQTTSFHICEFLCAKVLVFVVRLQNLEICHLAKELQGFFILDYVFPNVFLVLFVFMIQNYLSFFFRLPLILSFYDSFVQRDLK